MCLWQKGEILSKVAVAMSGGVDSTTAALILREAGHQVVGLSLSLGIGPDLAPGEGARAARQLGVEHQVVPAAETFRRWVLEPVRSAYAGGQTPNPCALCNAKVKFTLLWETARRLGCQNLATGHYARLAGGEAGTALMEGADPRKSQAYFLARLAPELLPKLLFPLGGMSKSQVKMMAEQEGLVAAGRPESQDVCFLPPGGWDQLMREMGGVRPGVVEDQDGRVLARHQGLHRFTVGQRRGLGVSLGYPVYVYELDGRRASVKVGPRSRLWARGLYGQNALWYGPAPYGESLNIRVRYAHRGATGQVEPSDSGVKVIFDHPQQAVAPGQLAVFYRGPVVLGSAWIMQNITD